jgi:8-oxo-dGTP pyrophosphatase MutT (NUDIX family)
MAEIVTKQKQAVPHITYRNDAGGVVMNGRGEMALVLQQNGVWSLPKGKIEDGEDRVAAARREIGEETGVRELTHMGILGSYTRYSIDERGREDKGSLKRITVLLFTTTDTKLRPADPRIREARWVKPADAVNLLVAPKDQEFLASILHKL